MSAEPVRLWSHHERKNLANEVATILFGVPWTFKMWLGADIMDV